ncbi:EF-hand calcium-binding domain-containing protein 4B isoform X2 [Stegostoma tigrinum]|uniref:EF-hand calcium-binding domain-containing protein 4B isoform X2 n=1 Tax=Stegostoma tigrinum TaxID=3053191 RepID=UPI00287036CC|nr:EF-hand calcium-binding domain-containing protein 4B isoform X2 [Stegostoma tigrinum]
MEALEKAPLAEMASKDQREGGSHLSAQRDLVMSDCKNTEMHNQGHLALLEKSREFFQICDREEKGFINRADMQHLQTELSLSSNELQDVFNALDADQNGSLTLEEFTTGFSQFLFGEKIVVDKLKRRQDQPESLYLDQCTQQLVTADDDEEHHFQTMMENLGARKLFKDQQEIRNLWTQLRKDEPHLLTHFEEFLERVSIQIQEANEEREMMEFALKRKAAEYSEEIKQLYNEMEQQIKSEENKIFQKNSDSKSRCQELEYLLSVKEKQYEELIQKQNRLDRRCVELLSEKQESKLENQRLRQINEELENHLQKLNSDLLGAHCQMQALEEETYQQHEEREMELYRVTEGLEREKLSLCKQLDLLREMNKHLQAERDMSLMGIQKPSIRRSSSFWNQRISAITDPHVDSRLLCNRKGDDKEELSNSMLLSKNLGDGNAHSLIQEEADRESQTKATQRLYLQRIISIEEDPLPQFLEMHSTMHLNNLNEVEEEMEKEQEEVLALEKNSQENGKVFSLPRTQPAGEEALILVNEPQSNPDRLFKIIFVGNSSVGKSSVLRRFCGEGFSPGLCATVGIDYQVKTVKVDNCLLALQLWDTAGQERFRSVTKQFFRKADGVVLMYDITAATTFSAIRQWLESVQEGAGPEVLILLLANKTDLERKRQVASEQGRRLAKEYNLIFYECSAFSGVNVTESMMHLASPRFSLIL